MNIIVVIIIIIINIVVVVVVIVTLWFSFQSVWGSFWDSGRWGYDCCHSFVKNSYCTGEAGKGSKQVRPRNYSNTHDTLLIKDPIKIIKFRFIVSIIYQKLIRFL